MVISEKEEIIDFLFTQGNVNDRFPLKNKDFHDILFDKLIADKAYIGQTLFELLFIDGIIRLLKSERI